MCHHKSRSEKELSYEAHSIHATPLQDIELSFSPHGPLVTAVASKGGMWEWEGMGLCIRRVG